MIDNVRGLNYDVQGVILKILLFCDIISIRRGVLKMKKIVKKIIKQRIKKIRESNYNYSTNNYYKPRVPHK